MRRTLAVVLVLLLALEAPSACAAKQLGYAVLLSEGPDKPKTAGQTVAWGSYHITITGEGAFPAAVHFTGLCCPSPPATLATRYSPLQDICRAREATPRVRSPASHTAALL